MTKLVASFVGTGLLRPVAELNGTVGTISRKSFRRRLRAGDHVTRVKRSCRDFGIVAGRLHTARVLRVSFMSGISRRFGAPVGTVRNCAVLLRKSRLSRRRRKCMRGVLFGARELSNLIKGVLLLSELRGRGVPVGGAGCHLSRRVHRTFLSLRSG